MSIVVPFVFVKHKTVSCDCHPHLADKTASLWCSARLCFRAYFVRSLQRPLYGLIKRHSLSVHLFADDIQIKTSILPQHVHNSISSVETYISDAKN